MSSPALRTSSWISVRNSRWSGAARALAVALLVLAALPAAARWSGRAGTSWIRTKISARGRSRAWRSPTTGGSSPRLCFVSWAIGPAVRPVGGARRVRDGLFGTGHDGKVFKLQPQGGVIEVLDAEEPDIFALAAGRRHAVRRGRPGGRIYRVGRDGKSAVMAELRVQVRLGADPGPRRRALRRHRRGGAHLPRGRGGARRGVRLGPNPRAEPGDRGRRASPGHGAGRLSAARRDRRPGGVAVRRPLAEIRQIAVDRYGVVYALAYGKESADGETKTSGAAADAIAADVVVSVFQQDETPKAKRTKPTRWPPPSARREPRRPTWRRSTVWTNQAMWCRSGAPRRTRRSPSPCSRTAR